MINLCSIEHCGKKHFGRGWCNTHYVRWRRHGDPFNTGPVLGLPGKWLNDHVFYNEAICLAWPFGKTSNGYGCVGFRGKSMLASRTMCILAYGEPPTPKHQASHSCGNGKFGCVNPKHLSWKTPVENMADTIIHGTTNRGARQWKNKLADADITNIRALYEKGKLTQKALGKMFHVTQSNINMIINGKTWVWLD